MDESKKELAKLNALFDTGKTQYSKTFKKLRMLDAADKGEFWKVLNAKFPPYQILPDTNFVSYIKNNLLASLYTVSKSADIVPTSQEDAELCTNLTIALQHLWATQDIGYAEFQAGERAALLNLGITQVGWNEAITGGTDESFYKGDVQIKNIDPMKFMRDPYADSLDTAAWCCVYDSYPATVLAANPLYADTFPEYAKKNKNQTPDALPNENANKYSKQNYFNLIIFWIRTPEGTIDEIHTVDLKEVLYKKEDIQPSTMPFAELYYNLADKDPVGVSAPMKIFANQVAYNLMDSIALTAVYKNQFPPKFVSSQSGLNVNAFAKHGSEADRTFIVNGDPKNVVYYHQFPEPSPSLPQKMQTIYHSIQDMSGVDERYTGRDTGSIITTGGTQEMMNRVTLGDAPAVMNYEKYTRRLTQLILANLIKFAPKRTYFTKDKVKPGVWQTVTIDFPKIDNNTIFEYDIQISSDLPKNRQRVAEWANTMMEKQMQYQQQGQSIDLITNEEWLQMQDVPYKEQMLERMGFQRATDAYTETAQVIDEYAQMIGLGMDPDESLDMTAQGLMNTRNGEPTPLQDQMAEQQPKIPV